MGNTMLDRFLKKSTFTSQEDFEKNFEFVIPENFNFAYDVIISSEGYQKRAHTCHQILI